MKASNDWTNLGAHAVEGGIHRIPLPMPGDALKAVNVYAVEVNHGLVLIDAGWAVMSIQPELVDALATIGRSIRDVSRILVTHVHRDHYTQAVLVRRCSGATIALGVEERPSLEQYLRNDGTSMVQRLDRARSGGAHELADRIQGAATRPEGGLGWEAPDQWTEDGAEFTVGDRTLTAVHTPGHTRGHLCYLDSVNDLIFAGDHVLPHITPSIGFEPAVDRAALSSYLNSLERLLSEPDRRLLPAHGPVTASCHERVGELLEHHRLRLDQILEAVRGGSATALQVARRIPWTRRQLSFRSLDSFNQLLAVSETAAHLDLLVARGFAHGQEIEGVWHYSPQAA